MPKRSSTGRLDLNQLAKRIAGHPGGEPLVGYLNSEEKVHETGSKDSGKQVAKEKTVRKANGNGVRGEPAGNPPA